MSDLSFSGMMVAGQMSELKEWSKRIKGDTSWPTPTQRDGISGSGKSEKRLGGPNLRTAVQENPKKMWPTPNHRDWKGPPGKGSIERGGRHASLPQAVREVFPTPMSRDWKSGEVSEQTLNKNSRPLSEYVKGQLNPDWVEWLMGFPADWTKGVS